MASKSPTKILACEGLHPALLSGLKRLGQLTVDSFTDEAAASKAIRDKEVLVVRSNAHVTKKIVSSAKCLKLIGRPGIGIDNIDADAQALCKKRGIKIITTPQATTQSVAELTIGLALSLLRRIPQAHASVSAGKWEKKNFTGRELIGRKWGILGFGRIGHAVAKLAAAFDCIIYMYDPLVDHEAAKAYGVQKVEDFNEFLSNCEILSIHVPLLPATNHLINAKALSRLPEGAYLINISRGAIVDEAALFNALKSNHLAGAALDVYEHEPPQDSPLLKLSNVVLTPHIGGSTHEGQARAADQLIDLLKEELARRN